VVSSPDEDSGTPLDAGPSHEVRDLWTLGVSALVTPLVWLFALGWNPTLLVGSHDEVATYLAAITDLVEHAHGDFALFSYGIDVVGGAKLHDVLGTLPVFHVCAWLGLSAFQALNVAAFVTQVLYAFLASRLVRELAFVFSGRDAWPSWPARIAILLLASFSPLMGWRVTTGHFAEVLGALFAVSVLTLMLSTRRGAPTFTLSLTTLALQLNALQTTGQQVVYGPVFLGVLLVAVLVYVRRPRALVLPALLTVTSVLLSLPKLAGMIDHARGTDASRGLTGASVIYSYITSTARDWLSSLPWESELISSHRELGFWHEVNFCFGPPLLLAAFLPWRKRPLIAIGFGVAFVLPLLFSVDAPGVAAALTTVVPPLRSFRVPARAMLAFSLMLPALAATAVLLAPPDDSTRWKRPVLTATAVGVALFLVPPVVREVAIWLLALWFVLRRFPLGQRLPPLPATVVMVALGLASLGAFKERLRPFPTYEAVVERPHALHEQLVSVRPELNSPLTRVLLGFEFGDLQTNSAWAMGLSSLSGYLNPPRRFVALEAALAGVPENDLKNYFRVDPADPAFPALRQLYNETIGAAPDGPRVRMFPLGDTAGTAWFSATMRDAPTMEELARVLNAAGEGLAAQAHAEDWVVSSDSAVEAASLPKALSEACGEATVAGVLAGHGVQSMRIRVHTDADCPLTVATNYATDLFAMARGVPLKVFPSYGALTGILVPKGTTELLLEARAEEPLWARLGALAGYGLLALTLMETGRLRRRTLTMTPA
jgi:hypothetical protein